MKKEIWLVLGKESLILCGDGRSDSPGHSTKYGTYVLMEQFLDVIVDIGVIGKRGTGGVSTNMEVTGLRKLLERIVGKLVVSEIVTDASTSIIALVRKMKGTVYYIILYTPHPPPSKFYELFAPKQNILHLVKKTFR